MHERRSIRLKDYDYTQAGAYFVTIATHQRACRFGGIVDGVVQLNGAGKIVQDEWVRTAVLRPNVELDAFVVMPNHFHGIIVITDIGTGKMHHAPTRRRQFADPIANSIPSIIGAFKAAVTRQINRLESIPTAPFWQRNYYEHIVRNGDDLNRIRTYIETNPARWQDDSLYSQ